jgi:REP element-mobilizing transposase RayT
VRLVDGAPSLREPSVWKAIVLLVRMARGRFGMHVVEYSVLTNHLHMIVECDHPDSLERGMRGFNTRLAKQLNKLFERRGKLVDGRYHSRSLESPRAVKNAIRYVLFNRAKHEQRAGLRPTPGIDRYSTAARFTGWRRRPATPNHEKDYGTSPARTWLMTTGWKRHGLLDIDETPTAHCRGVAGRVSHTPVRSPSETPYTISSPSSSVTPMSGT